MVRLFLVALGIGVSGVALGQTETFPDIPDNHWVFEALYDLDFYGVGKAPSFPRFGGRPYKRVELATSVANACGRLHEIAAELERTADTVPLTYPSDFEDVLARRYSGNSGHSEPAPIVRLAGELEKLVDTFAPELRELRLDASEVRRRIRVDADSILKFRSTSGTSIYPDVPDNHWAFEAMANLNKIGLMAYPYYGRSHSRRFWGVHLNAACARLHALVKEVEATNDRIALTSDSRQTAEELQRRLKALGWDHKAHIEQVATELRPLLVEFAPEMKTLGISLKAARGQVSRDISALVRFRVARPGEATETFSDVPAGHWASAAVDNLRRAGIVRGYLDGSFRG